MKGTESFLIVFCFDWATRVYYIFNRTCMEPCGVIHIIKDVGDKECSHHKSSGHCDVTSNRLWCHSLNVNQTSQKRGSLCEDRRLIVIYRFCTATCFLHCQWYNVMMVPLSLTHWGRVTHVCVGKTNIIGSDNGLSPGRHQAIIWTDAGILLIRPLGTNFNELLIEILTFSFMKMRLKVSSAKWRPYCLGLNVSSTPVRYGWDIAII